MCYKYIPHLQIFIVYPVSAYSTSLHHFRSTEREDKFSLPVLGSCTIFRCVKVMVLLYYLQTLPRECDSGRCHGDTLWVPVAASDCATGSQGARDGGTGTALA